MKRCVCWPCERAMFAADRATIPITTARMRMVMLMSLIMADDKPLSLGDLDARLREVEAIQEMMLRILATTKPLDNVLEQYCATDTQERACYALLDALAARTTGRENERPTFAFFEMKMADIFPALRKDRE